MKQKEIEDFIYFLTNSKNLTKAQRLKRDRLLAKTCSFFEDLNSEKNDTSVADAPIFEFLSALETAQFLSLFNVPFGLKYLTHDFDAVYDGRPHTLDELCFQVGNILKKGVRIPHSLWVPIHNFAIGGGEWKDSYGAAHNSSIINARWREWSALNNMHPINNPDFSSEIMAFRSTIRLVPPLLTEICDKAKKGLALTIKEEKLEKADFYTNTYILYVVIKRILSMMNRRANQHPNVEISFKRATDSQGRMLRQILITQYGSFAKKSVNDAKERLTREPEAGDFGSIRNSLNGYCLWQVESFWDGKPYRWNILKTNEMNELEEIEASSINGFTHILTFYIV